MKIKTCIHSDGLVVESTFIKGKLHQL